jgi:hypothetical protein
MQRWGKINEKTFRDHSSGFVVEWERLKLRNSYLTNLNIHYKFLTLPLVVLKSFISFFYFRYTKFIN